MLANIFDILFGCWHRNLTRPFTPVKRDRRQAAAIPTGTYVVCLDCGREFPYDLSAMRVIDESSESVVMSRGDQVQVLHSQLNTRP